jgi:nitrate reductase beta subunit
MYRYLAIANYEDRFVIPTAHREEAVDAFPERGGCGFSFGDGCSNGSSKTNLFGTKKTTTVVINADSIGKYNKAGIRIPPVTPPGQPD